MAHVLHHLHCLEGNMAKNEELVHRPRSIRQSLRRLLITAQRNLIVLLLILGGVSLSEMPATAQESGQGDLSSLEKLLSETVTSVAKKEEPLLESPSAIFVITQEDIRRSGATSIAEALRMAPGIQVAHIDANKWAITSRGFNQLYANKLLVLIDGRTVYTPIFSGVYWEVQDMFLADVDRIEVIRGPGAALWGANAVNGVINIITKRAKQTQGWELDAGAGNQEQGIGARYGGQLGTQGHYRFFTKFYNQDSFLSADNKPPHDQWNMTHGGGRIDWELSERNSLTLQGDFYKDFAETSIEGPISLVPPLSGTQQLHSRDWGGNLLSRWNHQLVGGSDLSFQIYYDYTRRNDYNNERGLQVLDLDFQHHFGLGFRHDFVWGLGYRNIRSTSSAALIAELIPHDETRNLFSVFLQDEIIVMEDKLRLTLGSKLERNDFTGIEVQPSARVFWRIKPSQSLWAAVSRAVRTPALVERGVIARYTVFPGPDGQPIVAGIVANLEFDSESLVAYELGYRIQPNSRFFIDLATFYNDYNDLSSVPMGKPFIEFEPAPPHVFIPLVFHNGSRGHTAGAELAAHWTPVDFWRLSTAYSRLNINIKQDPLSGGLGIPTTKGTSPQNQVQISSFLNLGKSWELDAFLYYAGALTDLNVPQYIRVDTRLGWKVTDDVELSLLGQNLLDAGHLEFGSNGYVIDVTRVPRSFSIGITWRH